MDRLRTAPSRGRLLLASIASIGLVVAAGGAVWSHDHGPPRLVLTVSGQKVQVGRLISYCWVEKGGAECADGATSFPAPAEVSRLATAIVIRKADPPVDVSVTMGPGPAGDAAPVPFVLVPSAARGRTTWHVVFELPPRAGTYKVAVFARWPDEDDPRTLQDALYHFHAEVP